MFSRMLYFSEKKKKLYDLSFFFSKNLFLAEFNYEIYNKKLLTIVKYFEKWKSEFMSMKNFTKMLTDHKNLKYFIITKKLNQWQICWIKFLANFNFKIIYQTEKFYAKTNFLTRRSKNRSKSKKNDKQQHQH